MGDLLDPGRREDAETDPGSENRHTKNLNNLKLMPEVPVFNFEVYFTKSNTVI